MLAVRTDCPTNAVGLSHSSFLNRSFRAADDTDHQSWIWHRWTGLLCHANYKDRSAALAEASLAVAKTGGIAGLSKLICFR